MEAVAGTDATPRIVAYDWVRHHAVRTPDKIAIRDLGDGSSLTYREFDDAVDRCSMHLLARGVRPGDRVALLGHNCAGYLVLLFACTRARAIFLPLNWRLAEPELAYILTDAAPTLLAHDEAYREVTRKLCGALPSMAILPLSDLIEALPGGAGIGTADLPLLTDVAAIMYTSGTTGRPKGALMTHQMTLWHSVNISVEAVISKRSVHLAVLPFFHTGGLNLYVNPVIHAGGTVVVVRTFDAGDTLAALTDPGLGVTHVFAVPTVYQSLAAHPDFEHSGLDHLVMAGVGGAACPLHLLQIWFDKGRPLAQGWGMTEAGPSGAVVDVDDPTTPPGSVGKPLLHIETRIVDIEGRDVPVGAVGELWIQGPTVTPGYWRNPAATAEAFSDGWFRTGDAARVDEAGNLFIVDRWKDMYISGGENVYPAEVEAVIAELAGVDRVAVIGVPDDVWGEVGKAFVVARPGSSVSQQDIIEHCRSRLARFKAPRYVQILGELPITGSGKVIKRGLDKAAR